MAWEANIENRTKIILTVIGLAAIIVPAVLLVVFSSGKSTGDNKAVNTGNRQIDQNTIEKQINSGVTPPAPAVLATPSPSPVSSTPSASPKTSSPLPGSTKSSGLN